MPIHISTLTTPPSSDELNDLATLLHRAVHAGAAVSFILPFTHRQAHDWWTANLAALPPRAAILTARHHPAGTIVGTVSLIPAWAPNQPHRAEICKLLVHTDHHRQGIGAALMHAAEAHAAAAGFTLLTLDAKRGGPAQHLYQSLGWTHAGTIPHYALDTDAQAHHDTVIYYKRLDSPEPAPSAPVDHATNGPAK